MEVQNLTRFGVYERQVWFECGRSNVEKISALGIKLPEQAVQILVCPLLPGTIGIGKIDVTMQPFYLPEICMNFFYFSKVLHLIV